MARVLRPDLMVPTGLPSARMGVPCGGRGALDADRYDAFFEQGAVFGAGG